MENICKRINIKLTNDSKEYLKCVNKPNFILQKIFDKNFIAVHLMKTMFDFSGYPKDSVYYDASDKKLLGKMKDELNGVKISEFAGLKSKIYSLINVDDKEINKAKGINKRLRHKECHDVLFNKKVVRHNMKRIQRKLHEIGTYEIFKISLSCFDDKRYVLDDGINTLAYFHKDIVHR